LDRAKEWIWLHVPVVDMAASVFGFYAVFDFLESLGMQRCNFGRESIAHANKVADILYDPVKTGFGINVYHCSV
jgi:hypothetical protein